MPASNPYANPYEPSRARSLEPIVATPEQILQIIADGKGQALRLQLRTQNAEAVREIRRRLRDAGLISAGPGEMAILDSVDPITTQGYRLLGCEEQG